MRARGVVAEPEMELVSAPLAAAPEPQATLLALSRPIADDRVSGHYLQRVALRIIWHRTLRAIWHNRQLFGKRDGRNSPVGNCASRSI